MDDFRFHAMLRAIAAGICISFGCICYVVVENHVVGAVLFSVGLLAIMEYNLNLFTGKIGLVKSPGDVFDAIIYLAMNMLGSMILSRIVSVIPRLSDVADKCVAIANTKMSYAITDVFVMGIFCGALMLFATKHRDNRLLTVMCVSVFIICGFEHSVADSFYLTFYNDAIAASIRIIIIAIGNAIGAIGMNQLIKER